MKSNILPTSVSVCVFAEYGRNECKSVNCQFPELYRISNFSIFPQYADCQGVSFLGIHCLSPLKCMSAEEVSLAILGIYDCGMPLTR